MTQKSRTIVVFAVIALAVAIVFWWNRRERQLEATPAPSSTPTP